MEYTIFINLLINSDGKSLGQITSIGRCDRDVCHTDSLCRNLTIFVDGGNLCVAALVF